MYADGGVIFSHIIFSNLNNVSNTWESDTSVVVEVNQTGMWNTNIVPKFVMVAIGLRKEKSFF